MPFGKVLCRRAMDALLELQARKREGIREGMSEQGESVEDVSLGSERDWRMPERMAEPSVPGSFVRGKGGVLDGDGMDRCIPQPTMVRVKPLLSVPFIECIELAFM